MIRDLKSIKIIDVLYRVSSIGQEKEGESLFVQRESVEKNWATPRGITVRRRIEVTESGKSALRLKGAGFEFSRRAEYTELIVEYQRLTRDELPDAICIDWADRWNRNPLELLALIEAFSAIGIRMLAIGDDLELTDPRQRLVTTIKSAVAGEQLRVISDKVRENRASRRARGKWQGGSTADGFRNHRRECPGLVDVVRETPDGERKTFRVRACDCPNTILERDPAREGVIAFVWERLQRSAMSYEGIAVEARAAGFTRAIGTPLTWNDVYRIGLNPHYAGIMATNRFIRNAHDPADKHVRPLLEQSFQPAGDAIPEPYVSEAVFWEVYDRRYATSHHRSVRRGSTFELYGILRCPECGKLMRGYRRKSSEKTGHGRTRKSPHIWTRFATCGTATCEAAKRRGYLRVDPFGKALIEKLAALVVLDDDAMAEALRLVRPEARSQPALQRERRELERAIATAQSARHVLIADRAADRISQKDYEAEVFAFRRDAEAAKERLRAVESHLSEMTSKPTFEPARMGIRYLADRWDDLTVAERAEGLRLLVTHVTWDADRSPVIVEWGPAFRRQEVVKLQA
ncbi:MAG: recombinase family protein [Candidatus Eremiobacteraeota bacterium]|nr:recombinase family protein [Candidatus Eremiobacteraeota bacterium]